MSQPKPPSGPDLSAGVPLADIPEGSPFLGHVGEEGVLLVRRGDAVSAVSSTCTHYSGPLDEGLVVGDEIRCPWHHARFCLRDGQPQGPALNPVTSWSVKVDGGRVVVGERRPPAAPPKASSAGPASVVIVGAGAAGNSAAETLRREGYAGSITLIGLEEGTPVDRPNLSKDFLAGSAPEEWLWLRDDAFYASRGITRVSGRATRVDARAKTLELQDGRSLPWGALLLTTGATPIRLSIPGADAPHVHLLRSVTDSRRISASAKSSRGAVVIGASFIGLEVAAALRAREVPVHVVANEAPLKRVLGAELSGVVQRLHESRGVRFHLGRRPTAISAEAVTLDDGSRIEGDLVVMGVGVRPSTELAETAGCRIDRGVVVDARLQTSVEGIFAAGDLARWPDPCGAGTLRVEHWVVAQRMGEHAARSLLGSTKPYRQTPFFWSQHYDVTIAYSGHAEGWDAVSVAGKPQDHDGLVGYRKGGKVIAVAGIFRDREVLRAEEALERGDSAALEALFP